MQQNIVRQFAAEEELRSISGSLSPANVLVAGPDQTTSRRIARELARIGYEVTEEADLLRVPQRISGCSIKASSHDAAVPVELLVLDLAQAPWELLPLLETIRNLDWMLPIAVLVDRADNRRLVNEARRLGATAIFEKPVQTDEVTSWATHQVPPFEALATA